jgi:tRNA dimethylallyltransferase
MRHRGSVGDIDVVLVAGPTASGKSALALALAERFGGVVVNADSMQVYRDLAIITARPSAEDLSRAPHRLYGHVDGAVNHSAGLWRNTAADVIASEWAAGRLPIIVGGTGLYFRALEQGLAATPEIPAAIRTRIRAEAEDVPTPALHGRLSERDPTTAARLRPSDRQRILRAIEVLEATGRPLADWHAAPHMLPIVETKRALRLFLAPERARLYARIDERFEAMLAAGALEEVARLAERRLDPALPVMRAHGVPGLLRHLRGEIGLAEAVSRAKTDTRHYARRQFTWFRHQMAGWTFLAPEGAEEHVSSLLSAGLACPPEAVSD